MTKTLEQALAVMALDYLKQRANKSIYTRWDRGDYGEVPLPKLPYITTQGDHPDIIAIIAELEKEVNDQ